MNRTKLLLAAAAAALFSAGTAQAQSTTTSPTGGALPSGVTSVGGVVVDLKGANGARVVTQAAASGLFVGFSYDPATNPGTANGNPLIFGTQTGFTSSVLGALGGGLSAASVRITLFDGDSAPGDFDFNDNTLQLNGIDFGNWSSVSTVQTTSTGGFISSGTGFGDNILSTGFFSSTDATVLANLFASLNGGSLAFGLSDVDPGDNFYDFTQGVDGGLIDVGTGPIVTPPSGVPEPATWAMMILGVGAIGGAMRRRRVTTQVRFA